MRTEGETAALVRCDSYEAEKVQAALDRAVGFLGGYDAFFRPGMRVVIKPNLMRKSDPALCAVVHPSVIRAVAKRAAERGAHVLLAESRGASIIRRRCGVSMRLPVCFPWRKRREWS